MFGYENKQTFPIHIRKDKIDKMLNLLLIKEGDQEHYVFIKDFNRFMFTQAKHDEFALPPVFYNRSSTQQAQKNCIVINGFQTIRMPEKGPTIQFKN